MNETIVTVQKSFLKPTMKKALCLAVLEITKAAGYRPNHRFMSDEQFWETLFSALGLTVAEEQNALRQVLVNE